MGKWQPRVLITYALLQIPGLVAVTLALIIFQPLVELSLWHKGTIIGLWVLKDVALYPFVWRAFAWHSMSDVQVLVGAEGTAEERLDPTGYVRVHGELWKAETVRKGTAIEKGTVVSIRGMRGLVLLVE